MDTIGMIEKFISLAELADKICNSNMDWNTKYNLIFSENISSKMHELYHIRYVDPDTSYEDDVKAFVNAANKVAKRFEDLLKELQ
jgi:hypothetical protein